MEAVATVEVILDPMSRSEFEAFLEQTVRHYADENVQAGYWHLGEALRRSREAHQKLLPEGVDTPGHHHFLARDARSGEAVGHIWLKEERDQFIPSGFIFAVLVYEQFRGRGYGTKIMQGIEEKASALGLRRLALHVFAQNPVAVHLYESAGYGMTSLNMMREIPR
jgi:GNAT superfamily N-acetyltransferase